MLNTVELCTKLKEKHISLLRFNTTYTKRRSVRPRKAFASMFLIRFPCKNLQIKINRESNYLVSNLHILMISMWHLRICKLFIDFKLLTKSSKTFQQKPFQEEKPDCCWQASLKKKQDGRFKLSAKPFLRTALSLSQRLGVRAPVMFCIN